MGSRETSPMGYVKEYFYDAFGNVTCTKDYGTDSVTGTPNITRVVYDQLGRKVKEIYFKGGYAVRVEVEK